MASSQAILCPHCRQTIIFHAPEQSAGGVPETPKATLLTARAIHAIVVRFAAESEMSYKALVSRSRNPYLVDGRDRIMWILCTIYRVTFSAASHAVGRIHNSTALDGVSRIRRRREVDTEYANALDELVRKLGLRFRPPSTARTQT